MLHFLLGDAYALHSYDKSKRLCNIFFTSKELPDFLVYASSISSLALCISRNCARIRNIAILLFARWVSAVEKNKIKTDLLYRIYTGT